MKTASGPWMATRASERALGRIGLYAALALAMFFAFFPIYWMLVTSLQHAAGAPGDQGGAGVGGAHQGGGEGGLGVAQAVRGLAEQGARERVDAHQLAAEGHEVEVVLAQVALRRRLRRAGEPEHEGVGVGVPDASAARSGVQLALVRDDEVGHREGTAIQRGIDALSRCAR